MPLSTKDLERQPPAMQANKEGRYTGQGKETAMNMSFISNKNASKDMHSQSQSLVPLMTIEIVLLVAIAGLLYGCL